MIDFIGARSGEQASPLSSAEPTPSHRLHPAGREHSPPALIELRADGVPTFANRLRVDHPDPHTSATQRQDSRHPESHHRMAPERETIHSLWRVSRRRLSGGAARFFDYLERWRTWDTLMG